MDCMAGVRSAEGAVLLVSKTPDHSRRFYLFRAASKPRAVDHSNKSHSGTIIEFHGRARIFSLSRGISLGGKTGEHSGPVFRLDFSPNTAGRICCSADDEFGPGIREHNLSTRNGMG